MNEVLVISDRFLWYVKLALSGLFVLIALILVLYRKKPHPNEVATGQQTPQEEPGEFDQQHQEMLAYLEAHGKNKTPSDQPQKKPPLQVEQKFTHEEEVVDLTINNPEIADETVQIESASVASEVDVIMQQIVSEDIDQYR